MNAIVDLRKVRLEREYRKTGVLTCPHCYSTKFSEHGILGDFRDKIDDYLQCDNCDLTYYSGEWYHNTGGYFSFYPQVKDLYF